MGGYVHGEIDYFDGTIMYGGMSTCLIGLRFGRIRGFFIRGFCLLVDGLCRIGCLAFLGLFI